MIVIIGGSSFVGAYLVDELISQGRKIVVTGRNKNAEKHYKTLGIPYVNLDISNETDYNKLPKENIHTVIMLAGMMPANIDVYDPTIYKDYFLVNTIGTLNALEYARKNNVEKFIFTSSESDVAMYWNTGKKITETDPRAFKYTGDHSVYSFSKTAAVDLVEHYRQEFGLKGISFRLTSTYGYGCPVYIYVNGKKQMNGFGTFIDKAQKGEKIEIWGDPNRGKDIVCVKDVVQAYISAIDSDRASGLYNVATGVITSLEEQVKQTISVFGNKDKKSEIVYRPEKPDMRTYCYDIKKAEQDLGYKVKYSFRELLEDYKEEMNSGKFKFLSENRK